MIARRSFLTGLGGALITAPAIVRAGSLMPVKQMVLDFASFVDALTVRDAPLQTVYFQGRLFWITGKDCIVQWSAPCENPFVAIPDVYVRL